MPNPALFAGLEFFIFPDVFDQDNIITLWANGARLTEGKSFNRYSILLVPSEADASSKSHARDFADQSHPSLDDHPFSQMVSTSWIFQSIDNGYWVPLEQGWSELSSSTTSTCSSSQPTISHGRVRTMMRLADADRDRFEAIKELALRFDWDKRTRQMFYKECGAQLRALGKPAYARGVENFMRKYMFCFEKDCPGFADRGIRRPRGDLLKVGARGQSGGRLPMSGELMDPLGLHRGSHVALHPSYSALVLEFTSHPQGISISESPFEYGFSLDVEAQLTLYPQPRRPRLTFDGFRSASADISDHGS
ncbi:hypothetical protein BCR39DRAFT_562578 [Naematelia encephala]|uniref:Uncharacterized protein n=1 Tax=Naematelia encephala TaxID=71784 RepID=A0A1Y2AGR6_9TREE|nr:hypothetical protein BCR39DRAFT_562578 [Naematelia encephala]